MHVDGFRFDLASALARELHDVDRLCAFFDIIHQDPMISQREADRRAVGRRRRRLPGGQLSRRLDGVERPVPRRACGGSGGATAACCRSSPRGSAGSSDLYERSRAGSRTPASTSSPPRRLHARRPGQLRTQAQRGQRRAEPRRRPQQPELELRGRGPDRRTRRFSSCAQRQRRNFLADAVPVDRRADAAAAATKSAGRSSGNNNAYCQDSPLTWTPWAPDADARAFYDFVRRLIALRASQPVLRRRHLP